RVRLPQAFRSGLRAGWGGSRGRMQQAGAREKERRGEDPTTSCHQAMSDPLQPRHLRFLELSSLSKSRETLLAVHLGAGGPATLRVESSGRNSIAASKVIHCSLASQASVVPSRGAREGAPDRDHLSRSI